MKTVVIAIAITSVAVAGFAWAPTVRASQGTPQTSITIPPDELKAYKPIETAKTLEEAFTAARAFIARYPASAAIPQVEILVSNRIFDMPKDDKRLAAIVTFKEAFPKSAIGIDLDRSMVEYYIGKNQLADVVRVCEAYIGTHPNDTKSMYLILRVSVDGLKTGNTNLIPAGVKHGKPVIETLDAGTRPPEFATDADWTAWKAENAGPAYQSYGIIGLATNDMAMGETYMRKAVVASPADPLNYFFLANIKEAEYAAIAQKFNRMIDKAKPEAVKTLEEANAKMDEVLRLMARTVVLSEGKPVFKDIFEKAKPAFDQSYQQRHGKMDGADKLLKDAREGK